MSYAKDIIHFGKWLLSEFKLFREGNASSGVLLDEIWSSGFNNLRNGYSVSKLLLDSSIEEQLVALQKYKDIVENKPF
jgi:hypothetical protein